MFNIYHHSHFCPDAFGHGGNKRTAQVRHLLFESGVKIKNAELANNMIRGNKLSFYLRGLQQNFNLRISNKNKYAIGRYKTIFEQFVKLYKPDLFIWESTVEYHLLLAEVLYKHNIPIIALPHNLESLVAGNKSVFSNKPSPQWLFEEMDYLKLSKKVFTISREEYWLLSNYGIKAGYLPYYPAPAAESFLLSCRQNRKNLKSKTNENNQNVLLLGTFHNPATSTGFIELLHELKFIKGLKIDIAGFGSENFRNQFSADYVHIWGSVDSGKLTSLISNADCAVVHQQPSSGALTRITELLIAGLPVIANTHAARSCDKMEGLYVYNTFDELKKILSVQSFSPFPVPGRPKEEEVFSGYIKELIRQ